MLVATLWPFAEVVAERVGTPEAPVLARLPLEVPERGAHLEFAYGVNPERWLDAPSGPFTFTVAVEGSVVLRATLDPQRRVEDRAWTPAAVALGPWAGRHVTLALAIEAPAAPREPERLAGWAEPRLVDSR